MYILCMIQVLVNAGGIPVLGKYQVRGKVLSENKYFYKADFRNGLKNFIVKDSIDNYKKVLVQKSECIQD